MLRQSSSGNHRVKKLRPRHSLQAFLLVAVGIWIVYQLTRSYSKRRAMAVETNNGNGLDDGEPARRRLGRKGFVEFAGHASDDDIVGVRGGSDDVGQGTESSDDPLSNGADHESGDGDEEDQPADEDDGVDDAEDGLSTDEEEDGTYFPSHNGSSEDELRTVHHETDRAGELGNGDDGGTTRHHQPKELNSSSVPRANATSRVQDVAASLMNATDIAADGSATPLSDSALKTTSSVNGSLHDRGTAGDVDEKSLVNSFAVGAPGAENEKPSNNVSAEENHVINQSGTADSIAGHGISS